MLGCVCRIHLGIQWPRIWCSRYYSQHQLGRLHGLFPTLPIFIFWCASELHAQHKCFITHVFQSFSLNTNINTHVLQSFSLNTKHQLPMCSRVSWPIQNISSIMCFRVHIIICNWLTPNISNNHHTHVQLGLMPNIEIINIKATSHAMGLIPISVRSKFEILHGGETCVNSTLNLN